MNYNIIYISLVNTRRCRGVKKERGYEIHHIHPRCMGGSDSLDNLVKLTYREHYVAHWLLCKMYPTEVGIQYGFLCMLRDPHGNRKLTSRMVSTIKNNYSAFKRWHSNISNPGKSQQSRDAARRRMSGPDNPMRGRPEINPTARPHSVIFLDGTQKDYKYGKEGYTDLGMSRSSWIAAVRSGKSVRKYNVYKIIKHEVI